MRRRRRRLDGWSAPQHSTVPAGCILKRSLRANHEPRSIPAGRYRNSGDSCPLRRTSGGTDLLDGRAQPPCRRSDHAKTPIKLPDFATPGAVPLLLTTIVPAFRTGIRSDFHWKISRSSALQISDRDSMKTMRKIFSMTIRCSTQKVYGQGFGCSA